MRCSPFTAVYDACVLYPAALRDLLMWLGLSGLYRARWTSQIHEEWKRNVLKNRPDLTPEQVENTSALMDMAIPDGLVTGYEGLCSSLDLPDPDDRHVLAAYDIEPMHPDDFISDLWDLDQAAVLAAAQKQRRAMKRPSVDAEGYLEMLMRQGLVQTSKVLGPYEVML